MKCGYPVTIRGKILPCGRCMPCRVNHKRMWAGRILLENSENQNISTFLTMTYDEEHKPKNNSLSFRDLYDYLNRLRGSSLGHFRYFAVGEYGDKSARPHYHMAVFNTPPDKWEQRFQDAWPHGFTKAGEITRASAGYIAGYCTKKMTSKEDDRLDGRVPEFSRMSKKPPLGAQGMMRIRDTLFGRQGSSILEKVGDVPAGFRIEGKIYPIGRYWRTWLRKEIGITNPTGHPWEVDLNEITKADQERARKAAEKLFRRRKTGNRSL